MTRLKLTLIAMTFFGFAKAQSFKLSAGYGFPWITQQIGTNTSTNATTTIEPGTGAELQRTTYTTEDVRGSYGAGWNVGGSYIYEFSNNISVDLGVSYVFGRNYTTQSSYTNASDDAVKSMHFESETSKSRAILFTPMFKFSFYDRRRKLTPYFFGGPVVSKTSLDTELKRYVEENGNVSTESKSTKFRKGLAFGVRGGGGVNVKLSEKISLFSEVSFTGMNYYPKESEITRFIVNGEDNLVTLSQNVRKTIYVNKLTTDTEHTAEEANAPGKSLRFPVAMSSVSLNVGVLIKPN